MIAKNPLFILLGYVWTSFFARETTGEEKRARALE
jgi:hypothetical protein